MKAETKKQWIEALRSGRYKQTRQCLRNPHGYCCLGVLMDCYLQTHDLIWFSGYGEYCYRPTENEIDDKSQMLCHFYYLPRTVPQFNAWMGELDEKIEGRLSTLNDIERESFEQIADWIEKNVKED